MTRVVISQPMYYPWPGFLAQIALADVLIWLDDAQFSKGSFTNRIQVLLNGKRHWMSVPLEGKGSRQLINELKPSQPDWVKRHRDLLSQSLQGRARAKQSNELFLSVMSNAAQRSLCGTLIESCEQAASKLGVLTARRLLSSQMDVEKTGWARVLDLVLAVDGTEYITGHGAANYLDHEAFENAGVNVEYMDYQVIPWDQPGEVFTPFVSILDMVSVLSYEEARLHLNPKTIPWRSFASGRNSKRA